MELFNLTFETPIDSFEGGVTNLGAAIDARSGVWTFEVKDASGQEVAASELGLSTSSHLDSVFAYVSDTPALGLMPLPKLALRKRIASLRIDYVPIFTRTPIKTDQFGALVFLTNIGRLEAPSASSVNLVWPVGSPA